MNTSPQDQILDERIRAGIGSAPVPDFQIWCERHPEVLAELNSLATPQPRYSARKNFSRRMMMTTLKWIAASAVVAGAFAWFGFDDGTLSPSAFAQAIPGVDDVQTMTWTEIYFHRVTGEDGKSTWIEKERRLHAYRHPGQYRETMLNGKGEPIGIHISDNRAGRMLAIDVKGKKAVLKAPAVQRGERPPFDWVGGIIRERKLDGSNCVKSVSLQGQKQIDKVKANVVRAVIRIEEQPETRQDFLFDVTSKRLVGIYGGQPGEPFDPATIADLNNPAKEKWSKRIIIGTLTHEIVLNPKLVLSEFSLDPPADFAFEKILAPTVTEDEMVAYLAAAARFRNGEFPDSPFDVFDRDKLNVEWEKEEAARTPEATQLIELVNKFRFREIYSPPVRKFVDDHTARESFYYVGSGVKIGQTDRIVCWYILSTTGKHRAVYGDLTVKDVAKADLPLSLLK